MVKEANTLVAVSSTLYPANNAKQFYLTICIDQKCSSGSIVYKFIILKQLSCSNCLCMLVLRVRKEWSRSQVLSSPGFRGGRWSTLQPPYPVVKIVLTVSARASMLLRCFAEPRALLRARTTGRKILRWTDAIERETRMCIRLTVEQTRF